MPTSPARSPSQSRWSAWIAIVACAASLVGVGCSDRTPTDASVPSADAGSDGGTFDAGNDAAIESLVLLPESRRIDVLDGAIPRLTLQPVLRVGSVDTPVDATITVTPGRLAVLEGMDLVPTGVAGGEVHVRVVAYGPQGRHVLYETFEVHLRTVVRDPGVTDDEIAALESADEVASASAPSLLYPIADTMMPANVAAPSAAWAPAGSARTLDRFRMTKPYAEILYYGRSVSVTPTLAAWRGVVRTEVDEPITIDVARYDSTTGHRSPTATQALHIARTTLSGSVYYWNVAAERILRIDDGADHSEDFMPAPGGCVGCHTISPSGRHLVTSIEGTSAPVGFAGRAYDLESDLTSSNPTPMWRAETSNWYSAAVSPDERTVVGATEAGLIALDLETGASLPVSRTIEFAASPAFSPDGRTIVFVQTSTTIGPINQGGLAYASFERVGDTVTFGIPQELLSGSDLAYPSFSPDGAVLAYGAGTSIAVARVVRGAGGRIVLDPAARLSNLAVGTSVHPVFSPFHGDGHYWLTYHSDRGYAPGGTGPFLWVTAIRDTWRAGEDPSEPPYWLLGQDRYDHNLSAFWTLRECLDPGATCTVDVDCCSGYCRIPPGGTEGVCSTDLECRIEGESCETSADCCEGDGLLCVDGTCQQDLG